MKRIIVGEEKISKFIEEIKRKADEEIKRIIENAKREAENIINRAERELERRVEAKISQETSSLEEEDKRRVAEARLEARRMILEVKEKAISSVFEKLKSQLREFTRTQDYVEVLSKLVCEAGIALGGGELIVEVNEDHKNLNINWDEVARTIEEKTGKPTKISVSYTHVSDIGGAIVRTADGRFTFDNTFEGRIDRMQKTLRLLAAKRLFE